MSELTVSRCRNTGSHRGVDIDLTFPVNSLIPEREILSDPDLIQAVASCQSDNAFGNSAGY